MQNLIKDTSLEAAVKKIAESINASEGLSTETYTEEDLFYLYNLGYKFYGVDDFPKSEKIFRRLVVAKPFDVRYWQALGSTLQMQKNYENALLAWSMCALLNKEAPEYHLYAACCLKSQGESDQAIKALTLADKIAKEDSPFRGKIQAYKEAWGIK